MKTNLILENGMIFAGESMGSTKECICELVFNTSMVGYQQILTDASYGGQGIVMTYPLIGNYGVNSEDNESRKPWAKAFVVRHLAERGSNFRCNESLPDYLKRNDITGIMGIDTRALTRILRNQGTMNAMVTCAESFIVRDKLELIKAYRVEGQVEAVTINEPYTIPGNGPRVAMLDYGVKNSMVSSLSKRGCRVTVLPAHTPTAEILKGNYDGVMLSNGPGDPQDCKEIIQEIKELYASGIPIFAVCLGHQLMALATGADTEKLKYGHRGANHPVRDNNSGNVYITSQNHGYVVIADTVDKNIADVSHINCNDDTVEGLRYKNGSVFTVQFHPEASPGPTDTGYLFEEFIALMGGAKNA